MKRLNNKVMVMNATVINADLIRISNETKGSIRDIRKTFDQTLKFLHQHTTLSGDAAIQVALAETARVRQIRR